MRIKTSKRKKVAYLTFCAFLCFLRYLCLFVPFCAFLCFLCFLCFFMCVKFSRKKNKIIKRFKIALIASFTLLLSCMCGCSYVKSGKYSSSEFSLSSVPLFSSFEQWNYNTNRNNMLKKSLVICATPLAGGLLLKC